MKIDLTTVNHFYLDGLAILDEEPKFGVYQYDRCGLDVYDQLGVFAFLKDGKGDVDIAEFWPSDENRAYALCKTLNAML